MEIFKIIVKNTSSKLLSKNIPIFSLSPINLELMEYANIAVVLNSEYNEYYRILQLLNNLGLELILNEYTYLDSDTLHIYMENINMHNNSIEINEESLNMTLVYYTLLNKFSEAAKLEKQNEHLVIDYSTRLNQALQSGIVCSKENYSMPKWINNKYLKICYNYGYSLKRNK